MGIDFRELARQRLGAAWELLGEADRAAHTRAEKRAHLEQRLGGRGERDYGAWLRSQPPAVQDRVLGRRRAERYRAGDLHIDRFTDPPGAPLTLEQLAATRPEDDDLVGPDSTANP